jgi:hypothetical protein
MVLCETENWFDSPAETATLVPAGVLPHYCSKLVEALRIVAK